MLATMSRKQDLLIEDIAVPWLLLLSGLAKIA